MSVTWPKEVAKAMYLSAYVSLMVAYVTAEPMGTKSDGHDTKKIPTAMTLMFCLDHSNLYIVCWTPISYLHIE